MTKLIRDTSLLILLLSTSSGSAQDLEDADLMRVCRAAEAVMMGRDVRTVRSDGVKDSIAYVSYVRPDDKKLWKGRCRVAGPKVIWSTVDAFGPGTGFGRWRDHPLDEVITYRIEGKKITITQEFSDRSRNSKTLVVD